MSKKTQWAIFLGVVFFFGIHIWGSYSLSNFELHGHMNGIQDVVAEKLAKRYDKIALGALISFWVIACK